MPETRARTRDRTLEIPAELHEALGGARRLVLTPSPDGSIVLRRQRARNRIGEPVRRLAGRGSGAVVARLASGGDPATYATDAPLPTGEYGIANYDVTYSLLPLGDVAEARSREAFWGAIEDYHEHRDLAAQEPVTHQVSRWLARDVLAPLGGRSYLELGCGAGRNLRALADATDGAALHGIDISESAIAHAQRELPNATLRVGSLYELGDLESGAIDVVYTSGVLMHVPHGEVAAVVREMHRIAARGVVHFELHGPSHGFDFHRYPRDYGALYDELGLPHEYEIFPPDDFRSTRLASFSHALLVAGA